MQSVIVLAVVALIALFTYLVWRAKTSWTVIFEDNGITDEASEKYSYLLNEGVRCRLKEIILERSGASAGMGNAAFSGAQSSGKVRLEVHNDHLDKANRLLENFNPNREFKI